MSACHLAPFAAVVSTRSDAELSEIPNPLSANKVTEVAPLVGALEGTRGKVGPGRSTVYVLDIVPGWRTTVMDRALCAVGESVDPRATRQSMQDSDDQKPISHEVEATRA